MSRLPLIIGMLLIGVMLPATAETPALIAALALAGMAPMLRRD
jgi:hypothetical protein